MSFISFFRSEVSRILVSLKVNRLELAKIQNDLEGLVLLEQTYNLNRKVEQEMGDVTKNFSSVELQCKCGCQICNISKKFMDKLQTARDIADIPFKILSGCRCPSHNAASGGKPSSDHITTDFIQCVGVDIACRNSRARFIILKAALEAGFKRVGLAKTFLHLGMSKENPQDVFWIY